MASDIINDVKEIRRSNKQANIDISNIAQRYIRVTEDRAVVESYLKNSGFSINSQPTESNGSTTVIAIYSDKPFLGIGFHDEVRLIIVFTNSKVTEVGGKLIYRSL